MGPAWGPSGADMTQVGPMLSPRTLLSGTATKTNCCHFVNDIFKSILMNENVLNFVFSGVCSWVSNLQYISIRSSNGLAPNRRQTIIWTNDTLVHWLHICVCRSGHLEIFYNDVIMGAIASQITSLTIVYSIVYSDAEQRKHQSSASLAFVRGIDRWIPRTNDQ